MKVSPIVTGRVKGLWINGTPVSRMNFGLDGPEGDNHCGRTRRLSGHDGTYIRTSDLAKGNVVFNWRSWTGISQEEIDQIELSLGLVVPGGCFLENLVISGIPEFSKLPPTSRLVFPERDQQAILAVWEENTPCHGIGDRFASHYGEPSLSKELIAAAQDKRGVMGFVLSPGTVRIGDTVLVYPPAR